MTVCELRTLSVLAEALDAARGVDELLLARVERMAVATDVGVNLRLRGASGELITAGALDRGGRVRRMDIGFHGGCLGRAEGIGNSFEI